MATSPKTDSLFSSFGSKLPILSIGFRPFFLVSAIFAIVSMLIWMSIFVFQAKIQLRFDLITWHAHEMIFGYALAVTAGFLLTAVQNWTGLPSLQGKSLLFLVSLWAIARILPLLGEMIPIFVISIFDLSFIIVLIIGIARPIFLSKNWKNLKILMIVFLLFISHLIFYLGALGQIENGMHLGIYFGFYLIITMILVIGQRILPFFIKKGVSYQVTFKEYKGLGASSMVLMGLYVGLELFESGSPLLAWVSLILAIMHTIRLASYYTSGIWKNPLLWVLYLSYASIIFGFLLRSASFFIAISPLTSLHAFAVGGIGAMTVGMMARVSLGHTGRSLLNPRKAISVCFILIFLTMILRVVLPIFDMAHYKIWIVSAQALWIATFFIFLDVYYNILISPRPDANIT